VAVKSVISSRAQGVHKAGGPNFVAWRLMSVCPQCGTCSVVRLLLGWFLHFWKIRVPVIERIVRSYEKVSFSFDFVVHKIHVY
jgi:hypothetical protein